MQEYTRTLTRSGSNADLAASLAKLWPHREHESNALKSFFCLSGWHQWRQLNLEELAMGREVKFCFWCSKIRVDGEIYDA